MPQDSRQTGIGLKKLKEIEGWIEVDEDKPKNEIPSKCPKCGSPLWKTNALQACGMFWVGCKNLACRWCEIYTE